MQQTKKFNLRQHVTDQIIKAMEAGTPPWRQPWTGSTALPRLPLRHNGEAYRGINILVLWASAHAQGFGSAKWMTYRQAAELGGQVRKGEKATRSAFYGTFEDKNGDGHERIPFLRCNAVFNADQIDGLPEAFYIRPAPPQDLGTKTDARLMSFFDATGIARKTSSNPRAYYDTERDFVHMPPVETFHSTAAYFATLGHECAHATGHSSRLDRFANNESREDYAFDELVAELASAMLGDHLGLPPAFDQNAAYIETWINAMRADQSVIFKAAAEAERAFDFLTN
ncbi:MAG: zincin-like metallopeptidase domain-containing protein [Litoreibacter sp.]|nr:zincin-like metallopeptidase domain-containing protein [Litoreibacter sp.]